MRRLLLPLLLFFFSFASSAQSEIYEISNGTVRFHSDAPQELIKASSDQLKGAIDIRKRTFAFKLNISSFVGFNSPLQREHFNENYMETVYYPFATYIGKIIEEVDLSKDGDYTVRTKGKLKIHGAEQERIIKSEINVKNGVMTIESDFVVPLADHNIKIPRVVYDKLAPDINVSVNAILVPKK
ncbi:MAG TPA: YceI family protein [Flavipsychrobacter sp.]|nr:YceI family protein [Flavipsychrobacter sp.]